jgi:hypothetical protein
MCKLSNHTPHWDVSLLSILSVTTIYSCNISQDKNSIELEVELMECNHVKMKAYHE